MEFVIFLFGLRWSQLAVLRELTTLDNGRSICLDTRTRMR
jgi:hypothetical protein